MWFRKEFSQGKAKGFTLVEIMIVVGIVALLAAIAIPNLLRSRVSSNEAVARATLKTIANACETYAAASASQYPTVITDLTQAGPPYLNEDYTSGTRNGYDYVCEPLATTGYSCTATPAGCNSTGTKVYTMTTGGVLTVADCI